MEPTLEDGTLPQQAIIPDFQSSGNEGNSGKSNDDNSDVPPCLVDLSGSSLVRNFSINVNRLRPAVVNYWTRQMDKTSATIVHYSQEFLHQMVVNAYNKAAAAKEKRVSIPDLYKAFKNVIDYEEFKSKVKSIMKVHRMDLQLKRQLKDQKLIAHEGSFVIVFKNELELCTAALKDGKLCNVALPYDSNFCSTVPRKRIYKATNNDAEARKKTKIYIDSDSYIEVEKDELAKFRAAIKTSQHRLDSNILHPRLDETCPNPPTAALESGTSGLSSLSNAIGFHFSDDISDCTSLSDDDTGVQVPISDVYLPISDIFTIKRLFDEKKAWKQVPSEPQETVTSAPYSQPCDPNVQRTEDNSEEERAKSPQVGNDKCFI